MAATSTPSTHPAFWQQQIDAWQASGQSQRAFCLAHELNYSRFGYWLRKFRQRVGQVSGKSIGFVPVTPVVSPPSGRLSLVLPNGLEVRGIAPDNLVLVQQLLKRLT